MLKLINLQKTYARGDTALGGVDLELPPGQVLALIGPSGAGKSTLIRCINRLVEPTAGEIWVNGVNAATLRGDGLRKLRRRVGMIFQEYGLVDRLSVMENVLSGQLGYVGFWRSALRKFPQATINQAFHLLGQVGLVDHVNKRADQLSGGQRQRVGIARALLQQPDLLLVDEPTASLDPKTSRQIMRLIVDLAAERHLGVIINIHDVGLARMYAQRIVGLRAGLIVYDGSPEGLTPTALTSIYGQEDWEAKSPVGETDSEDAGSNEQLGPLGTERHATKATASILQAKDVP
jgi:phosphonate transport system ATP-binding protein